MPGAKLGRVVASDQARRRADVVDATSPFAAYRLGHDDDSSTATRSAGAVSALPNDDGLPGVM